MFKAFCDMCGGECEGKGTHTRRFERLGATKETSLSVGFELVLLFDNTPATDGHVCNGCLLDLIWGMAKKDPHSSLAVRLKKLARREGQTKAVDDSLVQLERDLAKRELALKEREEKLAGKPEQVFEKVVRPLEAEIHQLKEQLAATKINAEQAVKRITGEFNQRVEDMKNYPDYIANTDKREKTRRAGVN